MRSALLLSLLAALPACSDPGGADGRGELAARQGGAQAGQDGATLEPVARSDGGSYVVTGTGGAGPLYPAGSGGTVGAAGGATAGVGGMGGVVGSGGGGLPVDAGPVYCVSPQQTTGGCVKCNVYEVGPDGGVVGGMVGSDRCIAATLERCTLMEGDAPGWSGVWRGEC